MNISLQPDLCICSGACVLECPEVFAQDDDGIVVLLQANPDASLRDAVMRAVVACPAAIIHVTD